MRKRLKHRTDWIDVKSKCQLNKGEEHLNRKGQNKDAKKIGPPCSEKCRMKCFDKLINTDRKTIFESYWEIGDHDRQREFLARYVRIVQIKQSIVSPSQSRRNVSRKYFIPVNNKEIQVCQKMFLQTFAISDKVISNIFKKINNSPVLLADQRGKHTNRPLAIKDNVKGYIRQHIESFPVVDSHYIRSESTRKYLENGLSISKMHRLYLEWIKEKPFTSTQDNYDNIIKVTLRQYTDIFNNEFNLSFFKPKKDLCDECEAYKLASVEEKSKIQISYDKHLSNKTIARLNKNADKERALNDPKYFVAVFDLQKVLTSPQSEVSSFYYKRKYATYNFTIFDIGNKQGYCYMWTESEGNRGSNEIGTCLLKFIALLKDRGVEDFTFYSDNCGGQNRNRYIYSMWEYAASVYKVNIIHRFFEKGHTQNEGDSMHATIECAKKDKIIYEPSQWITLVRFAKLNKNLYVVYELSNEDFLNFKPLVENKELNWKTSTTKEIIKWNNIKEIMVSYKSPFILKIKYEYCATDFITIDILISSRNKGRHQKRTIPIKAYERKMSIDCLKKKDLVSLCDKGLIPSMYHHFYKSL